MRNRIVFGSATLVTDWSVELNDYYSGTVSNSTTIATTDHIFIGSTLPFNHIYIDATTTNANTSAIDIDLWDGDEWVDVAQVIDETSVTGITLNKSGFITWFPDKNEMWQRCDTVKPGGQEYVTGLGNIKIYDLFWARVNFSANLSAISLKWAGNIFSNDYNLFSEFPDLRNSSLMTSYESGKTTWFEQHILAAQIVVKDLLMRRIVLDPNQIMDKDDLTLAAVYKCAQIVYQGLGDDYFDNVKNCENEYNKRLNAAYVKIDTNENARIDAYEQKPYQFQNRIYR